MVSLASSSPSWQYSYAPHNRRVWRGVWTGSTLTTDEVTFWAGAQKLGTWALSWSGTQLIATMTTSEYYFAGRLIKNNTGYVASDRLGSIGKFYPWGQEKPSATTNGTEKFTGYYRDSETGNDYAVNRYHQPGMGRFLTADPSRRSMVPGNPGSWNRYAYVTGDPINGRDPTGMDSGLTEEYCNANPDDPDCQAGDYCEGFKTCEPGSAGGDGGGVCSSDTLGALAGAVEECVDPAPPPPPPQQQPCYDDVQMYTRTVQVFGSCASILISGSCATHQYLQITSLSDQLLDTVEGINQAPTTPGGQNMLVGGITVGGNGPDDNPSADTPFQQTLQITCATASNIVEDAADFYPVPYVFYAGLWGTNTPPGANSNTFMNWLLNVTGLSMDYPTPPPGAIGWYNSIGGGNFGGGN